MMPSPTPLHSWLQFIDDEYLSQFIRNGGASIKFVVTPEELRAELQSKVQECCQGRGYIFIRLDSGRTRAHMPQDIFFELARQIDWRLLARRRVLSLVQATGYSNAGEIDPKDAEIVLPEYFHLLKHKEIENKVLKSPDLAKDFRVAMELLCNYEYCNGEYTGQPILDWLRGVITKVSDLGFPIYTTINRSTARYFIESALHWVRHAGYAGTVILFDNSRVTLARNPRDGLRYYTRPMTMEHYEIMREFIDGADRLDGTLMLVSTSEDFLDSPSGRDYSMYQALYTRVMNDVYDRHLANPAASLVHLS